MRTAWQAKNGAVGEAFLLILKKEKEHWRHVENHRPAGVPFLLGCFYFGVC